MEDKLKPGEKGFSIILLFLGIGVMVESIKMFLEDPTSASFGALPLFFSVLIVILMLKIILLEDRKRKFQGEGLSFTQKCKETFRYIFRKDILVVLFLMTIYSIVLYLGLGFEISSTIFLFLTMTYLTGTRHFLANIFYTAIAMAFIWIVFKVIFQVVLP